MKKKISIILLLFTIFLSSITYVDEVWGVPTISDNYSPGSYSQITGCTGAYCYSGTVGFRVTLIDKETGKRCNYSYDKNKNILKLCSSTGTLTTSNDYWFNKEDAEEILVKEYCRALPGKYTKAEHLFEDDKKYDKLYEGVDSCKKNYTQYGEFLDIFKEYNDVTRGKTEYIWEGVSCNDAGECRIEPTRNPNNMVKIRDYFNERQKNNSTIELARIFLASTDIEISETDMSKLIKNGGVVGLEKLNVQFEQLLIVSNYYDQSGYASVGTVAETTYLYMNDSYVGAGMGTPYNRWCTISLTNNNTAKASYQLENKIHGYLPPYSAYQYRYTELYNNIYNGIDCDSDMFSGGYWTGWWNDSNIGSNEYKLSKTAEPVDTVKNIDTYLRHLDKGNKTKENLNFESFYNGKSTANIYSVNIADELLGGCNENARKILNSVNINTFNKTGKELNINYEYIEEKFKEDDKIASECYDAAGSLKRECYQLRKDYLENVGVSPKGNLCELGCNSIVEEQINNDFGIAGKTNIDKFPDGYKEIISYLYENIFTDEDGLDPNLWLVFFKNPAQCDAPEIPKCKPSNLDVKCDSVSKVFSISDSSMVEECIMKGWAYNDKDDESTTTKVMQSSRDEHYSSTYGDVFCKESVQFDIPGGGQEAVAGTVFKWKINTILDPKIFGQMKVIRNCYFPKEFREATEKRVIDSKWVDDDIDTTFTLSYEQALGDSKLNISNKTLDANLDIELYSFESKALDSDGKTALGDFNYIVYNSDGLVNVDAVRQKWSGENPLVITAHDRDKKNDSVSYDNDDNLENGGNNPRQFTCVENSDSCDNLYEVEMIATYNIVYSDDFTWYSDKGINGELTALGSKSDIKDNPSYSFAGYGLPTAYVTPDNEYCVSSYGIEGKGINGLANGVGKLNLIVSNVGTKSRIGGYHFNDYIKFLLKDDEVDENSTIDYYCDYKVKNPLFDTEYSSEGAAMCDPRTPKGIDVVFRTVDLISSKDDLSKAFPGRSGLGYKEGEVGTRTMGANWDKFSDESIADLLGEDIYSREPMYEITLDSPTIQTIRKWNNEARGKNIDPYTDMSSVDNSSNVHEGNTGYYYSKTDETVRSMFLTKLYEEFSGNEKFKSRCISTISDDGGYTRIVNCNQSWWLDDPDERNKISMELRTPVEG